MPLFTPNVLRLIRSVTVGTSTNKITFSNLDSNTDGDYLLIAHIINKSGALSGKYMLAVNGDETWANYKLSGTSGGSGTAGDSNILASIGNNNAGVARVHISLGADSIFRHFNWQLRLNGTTCNGYTVWVTRTSGTISNITQLDIVVDDSGNDIGDGSTIKLYAMGK